MTTRFFKLKMIETYDLNTVVDKLSILGIKTPGMPTLRRYISDNALMNWKKISFDSCSFKIGCASQLPVDPLQIGTEAGQIAPQDIINPMLFKTVTGQSFSKIVDTIFSTAKTNQGNSSLTETLLDGVGTNPSWSAEEVYYSLLADPSFRTAHPQMGMAVSGMVPLVREVYSQFPIFSLVDPDSPVTEGNLRVGSDDGHDSIAPAVTVAQGNATMPSNSYQLFQQRMLSGRAVPMPSIDIISDGSGALNDQYLPFAYVGCLIMPPAKMQSLYFRCIIEWNVTLSGFIPNFLRNNQVGNYNGLYYNWEHVPVDASTAAVASSLDQGEMLDTMGVESVRYVNSSTR